MGFFFHSPVFFLLVLGEWEGEKRGKRRRKKKDQKKREKKRETTEHKNTCTDRDGKWMYGINGDDVGKIFTLLLIHTAD